MPKSASSGMDASCEDQGPELAPFAAGFVGMTRVNQGAEGGRSVVRPPRRVTRNHVLFDFDTGKRLSKTRM
jgi:hypothetical protein